MLSVKPRTVTSTRDHMPITLQDIADETRKAVGTARVNRPLSTVQSEVACLPPTRDFFEAVTTPPGQSGVQVIAEFKRSSPSGGEIRIGADPADIAKQYENAGAVAISCLTDGPFFGGSLGDLKAIRDAVRLPILRKDFMIDPYQVWEARAAGADAVLLISELLDDEQLAELSTLADELGLTTLVEVHDLDNLHRIKPILRARHLLGVNNRNLQTMSTDIAHVEGMLEHLVDHMNVLVCESGIRTAHDVARLRAQGIHRFLIGETLLRANNPGQALLDICVVEDT